MGSAQQKYQIRLWNCQEPLSDRIFYLITTPDFKFIYAAYFGRAAVNVTLKGQDVFLFSSASKPSVIADLLLCIAGGSITIK